MAKYRKKPVVIDAVRYNGFENLGQTEGVFSERPTWLNYAINNNVIFLDDSDEHLKINTLEGAMVVNVGDYIIRGVKGEIYPCKPDIFEMSYTLDLTDIFKREILAEWVEGNDEEEV